MTSELDSALTRWRDAGIGVSTADDDLARYRRSITEHRPRSIVAVLRPGSCEQVLALLTIATATGVPVYPISTGRNWGLGSKLPVRDGCAVVELSRLDRIRAVSRRHRYAVIEPGVTQRALADYLVDHDVPLTLNVTGAGGHTSIVGNALERGVGILGQRQHEVRGLEVALATGTCVRTGLWHFADDTREAGHELAHHYPAGLGPDLTGLFLQSNLGITTAMVLGLAPRQPRRNLLFEVGEHALVRVVDAIGALRATGVIGDRVEMDEARDPRLAGLVSDPMAWLMWVPLFGDEAVLAAKEQAVRRALTGLCPEPRGYTEADLKRGDLPEAARIRLELTAGTPTNYSVESIARTFGVPVNDCASFDLDDEPALPGFLCVLPIVPLEGRALQRVIEIVRQVSDDIPVLSGMSFNTVSDTALEGYIRVLFARAQDTSVAQAHRWADTLHRRLRAEGVLPMRLDVDQMATYTDPRDPFWSTVRALKRTLDPRGVIAPGRYAPVE